MESDQADEEKEWKEGRKQTIVAKAKDKAKAKKDKAKGSKDGGSAGSTQTIAAMKAAKRQKETLPPVGYRP